MKSKILSIDYGTKNVGLAISPDGILIFVQKPLKNDPKLLENIKNIIETNQISLITIGVNQTSNPHLKTEEFILNLQKLIPNIEIITINEDFSTQDAFELMEQALIPKDQQQLYKDSFAAKIMLEKWLSSCKK